MRHAFSALNQMRDAVEQSGHLFVALDFDGTLCPIAQTPGNVVVPTATLRVLESLCESDRTAVAILSGRPISDLMRYLPMPVYYSGNHGLEIQGPGLRFHHEQARRLRPDLELAQRRLLDAIAKWPEAWVEDKELTLTVHYRAVDPQHHRELVPVIRRALAPFGCRFGMRSGRMAMEIHPRVDWNKGAAVKFLREHVGMGEAACLTIGDDRTDETMFRANPGQWNVKVGASAYTSANLYLDDPSEVETLLGFVAQWVQPAFHNAIVAIG